MQSNLQNRKAKIQLSKLSTDTDKQNHRGQIVESVTSGKDEKLFGIFFITLMTNYGGRKSH